MRYYFIYIVILNNSFNFKNNSLILIPLSFKYSGVKHEFLEIAILQNYLV